MNLFSSTVIQARIYRVFRGALGVSLGLLCLSSEAQMGGSYTIDQYSSPSSTNYQNFTSAIEDLMGYSRSDGGPSSGGGVSSAVEIQVVPGSGPYYEQVIIPEISGADATNTITFEGNGERIEYDCDYYDRHIIFLDGADHIRLVNLSIKALNSQYGWGIRLGNAANYNEIRGCDIDITEPIAYSPWDDDHSAIGIAFTNTYEWAWGYMATEPYYGGGGTTGMETKIVGNKIYGSTSEMGMYCGIALNGDSYYQPNDFYNTVMDSNEISNFRFYGILCYYAGGGKIRNNNIHNENMQVQAANYFYGVYYEMASNLIDGNKIHDPFPNGNWQWSEFYGIQGYYYGAGLGAVQVRNNVIYNINNGGYYYYGIRISEGADIENNSIHISGSTGAYECYGIFVDDWNSAPSNFRIRNNNIVMDNSTSRFCLFYDGQNMPNAISNNNNLYKGTSGNGYIGYHNNLYSTLANWQNQGAGWDGNSASVNPNFVNSSIGNMQPQVLELDGAGMVNGLTHDFNGQTRNLAAPDIGSHEFDIPINVTTLNFPTTVCQGSLTAVQVTVTNSSSLTLSNFKVCYSVNNVILATETYPGSLSPGASGNYTFTTPITSTNTGGYTLRAFVRGKTPTANVAYTVNPSPIGSVIDKGTNFAGAYNSGNTNDPDIVAYGDLISYEFNPPTGYNNNQYNTGTGWVFDFFELRTAGGTSAGSSYTKNNPVGGNDANMNFTPVMAQSDSTYKIRYAIRSVANGCVAPVVERTIFVAPRPVAAFNVTPSCEGSAVVFDNNSTLTSGSLSHTWDFGDGQTSTHINPSHVYSGFGTFQINLVVTTNYGYTHSIQKTVTVYENPTAEFASSNVCQGVANTFTDASIIPAGTPVYEWNFGDGSSMGTGSAPTHQYAQTGVYKVTMKVTANGCSDETSNYVTYAPRAVPNFTHNAGTCNSLPVAFTNSTTLADGTMGYSWDLGEVNATSTQMNPVHEYSAYGNIQVTLTVTTDMGCVNTVSKSFTLVESPKADFTFPVLCDVDVINFTNATTSPIGTTTNYEWAFSDGLNYSTPNVTRQFPSIGSYSVELSAYSSNGCSDKVTKTFSIDENPVAEFYVADVCLGTEVQLQNASIGNNGNVTYDWSLGNTQTSSLKNPVVNYSAVGEYTVDLVVTTPGGCSDNVSKTVKVKAVPALVGTIDVSTANQGDGTMIFEATSTLPATDYVWFFGDGGRESGTSDNAGLIIATYPYMTDGKYDVELRLTKAGCGMEAQSTASVIRTGLNLVSDGKLVVYPNPSNGSFTLEMTGENTVQGVSVLNAEGKVVYTAAPSAVSNAMNIDLGTVAPGVYYVRVESGDALRSFKLVIQ